MVIDDSPLFFKTAGELRWTCDQESQPDWKKEEIKKDDDFAELCFFWVEEMQD